MSQAKRTLGYLLLFLLPLFVIPIDFNFKALVPIYLPAKYFFWGIIVCALLILSLVDKKPALATAWRHPAPFFLIAFWLWTACSFLWSINRYQTLEDFTQWSLMSITIFLLIPLFRNQKQIHKAIFFTLLSVIIAILISFSEKYLSLFHLSPAVLALSFSSTFANTKFIAHYSIIILPLVVYFIVVSPSKMIKFLLASLLVLIFTHVYLINSTAKFFWLGLMLDLYLLGLFNLRKKPYFKKAVVVSVSLFLMSAGFAIYYTSQNLRPERRDSSMQQRYIIWKNTLRMIADHPLLGTGLGTFPIIYPKYESPDDRKQFSTDGHDGRGWSLFTRQTHNDILQIFQETGLVGISLFLLFIFFLLKDLVWRCKTEESPDNQKFLAALLFSISNLLLTATAYFPFHEAMSLLLFSFLVSISLASVRRNKLAIVDSEGFSRTFLTPFNAILCFFFLSFFSYTSLRFFMAEWHWNRANFKSADSATLERELAKTFFWNSKDWEKFWSTGLYCTRQRDYQRAKGFYEEAHRLSPYTAKIVYNLGVTHRQLGNAEPSLHYLDKTLKIAPDYSLPYYHLAVIAYDKKNYRKALRLFKKSQTRTNPFLDKAYCFAAICSYRLKKFELAKQEIIEALSINPDQLVYHRLLRIFDSELGVKSKTSLSFRTEALLGGDEESQKTFLYFSEAYKFLLDIDQKKRSEATAWFLTLPEKKLLPLLKLYSLAENQDLRFRLFYVLSEKLPHQIIGRSLSILNDKKERSAGLKVLSLRAIAKTSPKNLDRLYPFIFNEDKGVQEGKQTGFNTLQSFYSKAYLKN